MANLNFDTSNIEPLQPFSALPPGRYNAAIEDSEIKTTKAGTGEYLQLTFGVLDGEHAGRKLWARLNIRNPNKTAEEIAARELAAVCLAVGLTRVNDSAELHNRPLGIEVGVEKNQQTGEDTNRIRAYFAAGGSSLPLPAAAKAAPAASKPAAPWAKGRAAA